ncbi:TPA: HIT family protein [Candidatus Woesearchaeota archaeon]|nr:HIT family protein [Candidatus Woesearchaeota archaeon]
MDCKWCNFKDDYLKLKEYTYWDLYLLESHSVLGWCAVALKRHAEYFDDLTDKELIELKQVVSDCRSALDKAFHPDWFNVMQLGNMVRHIHFHLVPRYKDPREFEGRSFVDQDYGKMLVDRWKPEDKEFLTKLADHLRKDL